MKPPAHGSWKLVRPLLFQLDAENAHRLALWGLSRYARMCSVDLASSDVARHPSLATSAMGLSFPNPLGLAAGLDKNAEAIEGWQALGFGFIEVGTVTAHAQPGNPRPRLFRLPRDGALMNRMGFNNEGSDVVAQRLQQLREKDRIKVPLGVNLGKSKITPNEEAAEDYRVSMRRTAHLADYVVVNVSSPNTPGLRDLQKTEELARILDAVMEENAKLEKPRPVLVKLAPDLDDDGVMACAALALERACAGLIVTNTTISREGLTDKIPEGTGGISGAPLFKRSTDLLKNLAATYRGKLTLVGVGGIMDEQSAKEKLDCGADLIQVYSGFVYGGPSFPRRILRGLVERQKLLSSATSAS